MDLMIVPVPLFDKDVAVEAYCFRHQKGNDILEASQGTGQYDGAMVSQPLRMLNMIGLEAFTMGKPIFVPIDNFMLLAALELQCGENPEKLIFLLGSDVNMEEPYLANMDRLRALGYRFAMENIDEIEPYEQVLDRCEYLFFDVRRLSAPEYAAFHTSVTKTYPALYRVYTHVGDMEEFEKIKTGLDGMFEGRFYHTPITRGDHKVTPLQVNQINLLNMVRDENFEFDSVSKIIQRDTALTINLLRLVNSPYIGVRNKVKTINHGVTLLGQDEVRKWITTAVAKLLGADKPSEITRLSLVRAKFCESLAVKLGKGGEAQGLFLMGLFSVLDVILERPMAEALQLVHVSDAIYEALVEGTGEYYPIYEFLLGYENANWKYVSRQMILNDLSTDDVYEAYVESLCWYRELIDQE